MIELVNFPFCKPFVISISCVKCAGFTVNVGITYLGIAISGSGGRNRNDVGITSTAGGESVILPCDFGDSLNWKPPSKYDSSTMCCSPRGPCCRCHSGVKSLHQHRF